MLALSSVTAVSSELSKEPVAHVKNVSTVTFEASVNKLAKADYTEKSSIVNHILDSKHDRALELFTSVLKGRLFYVKKTTELVTISKAEGRKVIATSFISGEEVGLFKKRKVKKVGINNALRGQIKGAIAELELFSEAESKRVDAALSILKSADDNHLPLILSALAFEKSNDENQLVIEILSTAKHLISLKSSDAKERLHAITYLDKSLYVETRNGLLAFIDYGLANADKISPSEISLAKKTLDSINQLMQLNGILENVYFGIALGAVLLLAAIGLSITFGVMGVINMAHGEMIMLGAYTTFVIQQLRRIFSQWDYRCVN